MDTNRLIQFIYYPRVAVYLGVAATLLVSDTVIDELTRWILVVVVVVFPHVAFRASRRYFNRAKGARFSMLADAMLVGVLIVAMDFNLLVSVSMATCLVMGTLLICPPAMLLANLAIVAVICSVFFSPGQGIGGSWMQEAISVFVLLGFNGFVAFLCFRYTSSLVDVHRTVGEKHALQQHRLRPYISEQVLFSITADEAIDSRRKHLTVFFSDIEGFTRLMDQLNENTTTRLLNEYLNEMSQIAYGYGGTVDKYMGDGVMVLFGQSTDVSRDAVSCVKMALAMRDKLNELALGWQHFGRELHIRIGIHSGFCTVGNFGSAARMEYTAVGSVVNRASRLEGCADTDEILISATTYKLVQEEISCRAKPPVTVKGIDAPIAIYSVDSIKPRQIPAGCVRLLK